MDAGHYRAVNPDDADATRPFTLRMPVDYDESKVRTSEDNSKLT